MSTPVSPNTPEFNQALFTLNCTLLEWFEDFQLGKSGPENALLILNQMKNLMDTNNVKL
jgi:hypothetical protein